MTLKDNQPGEVRLVHHILEQRVRRAHDLVFLYHASLSLTFGDINAGASVFAEFLSAHASLGDRVVFLGRNSHWLVRALFGTLKAGCVFVPLHPRMEPETLGEILSDCEPKVLLADPDVIDDRREILRECQAQVFPVGRQEEGGPDWSWECLSGGRAGCSAPIRDISSGDLACIFYTSGSTGKPKGVVCTHGQIVFATRAINTVLGNTENDTILCGLPLSFDYGLYQIFLSIHSGAKLVLEYDFYNPMSLPELLVRHKITGFPGVPSLFSLLLRSRLLQRVEVPLLRYITSTGDTFSPEHVRQLGEMLPHVDIIPMYGLTECKRVSIMPPGMAALKQGSVGLPLPGTKVGVLGVDRRPLPPGEVGELVVYGQHVTQGYWRDEYETKRRFTVDPCTRELSLYTHDLFKQDDDGFLYFMGRRDNFIKCRGHRINPLQIETYLTGLAGVHEAAVVGIPHEEAGEVICAFVTQTGREILQEQALLGACRRDLRPELCPARIIIDTAQLPRTSNGKLDRQGMRRKALALFESCGMCPRAREAR